MSFFVIPLGWLTRTLSHGAARVLVENEVRSLENDVIQPVSAFYDEVYDDSVEDVKRRILWKRK